MEVIMREKKAAVIGILLLVFLFGAGVALGGAPKGECKGQATAEALKARATEYWQHRVKRNFEKTYRFESPERIKGLTLTDYIGTFGGGVKWLAAEVEKVTVKEKTGLVLVKIRYLWNFLGDKGRKDRPKEGLTNKTVDRWELVDGIWYRQFRHVKAARPKTQARTGPPPQEPPEIREEINRDTGKKME